jgi:hypothetical protein
MKKLEDYLIMESAAPTREGVKKPTELGTIAEAYNEVNNMLENIYQDFGKVDELMEGIMKEAGQSILAEDDGSWFDKITVKRNITELEKRGADFIKTFREVKSASLRLQALHEEVGFILNRYLELGE